MDITVEKFNICALNVGRKLVFSYRTKRFAVLISRKKYKKIKNEIKYCKLYVDKQKEMACLCGKCNCVKSKLVEKAFKIIVVADEKKFFNKYILELHLFEGDKFDFFMDNDVGEKLKEFLETVNEKPEISFNVGDIYCLREDTSNQQHLMQQMQLAQQRQAGKDQSEKQQKKNGNNSNNGNNINNNNNNNENSK